MKNRHSGSDGAAKAIRSARLSSSKQLDVFMAAVEAVIPFD
jgi:hypothetical protein